MFVKLKILSVLAAATALMISPASAENNNLSIELTGLKASEGKLFISIQKEADFKARRGNGGVFVVETDGTRTYSFAVAPGTYAISVWHDTDNDERFSMDKNWIPTDGWAMSGTPSLDKEPSFQEVKTQIPAGKLTVSMPMIYPG